MGSGKGAVDYWVAVVKPGTVIFEIAAVPEEVARAALSLAAYKLPIKTKFIIISNWLFSIYKTHPKSTAFRFIIINIS